MMFPALELPISRDMWFIQKGGQFTRRMGGVAGLGLFLHYKSLIGHLWPDMDQHRWFDLILKEWSNNIITVLMGCKDSGKTHIMAAIGVADYYCFPGTTLGLFTSTSKTGLDLRIWGDVKSLHLRAKGRYDWLPGNPIDSLRTITTDSLKTQAIRDLRRGLICIGSDKVGEVVGIKQSRRRVYADEYQHCKPAFAEGLANMNSGDFKAMFSGNPIGEGDSLDKLAEPKDGWGSMEEPEKTTVWTTRDIKGRCVNLVGTDSPNFDQSQEPEPKYPYMINQKSIERIVARYTMNSFQYFRYCKGTRMAGMDAKKVLTRDMCLEHHALEQVFWLNTARTAIYALDAAYGNIGGDRCVGGSIETGRDVTGQNILACNYPVIVPVKPHKMAGRSPEDQIALFVRDECERDRIPAKNVFYDATGRGSLGTAFSRLWSADVNPVEFGGAPTERPVSSELMILDPKTGEFRLMTARERFSKFVTELWFSVRYVVEAGQMRQLPEEVMWELSRRIWRTVRGDKYEVETKAEMKERVDESPDLADWLCFDETAMVLTPEGEVPIASIQPGQMVCTPHGPVAVESTMRREAFGLAEADLSNGRTLIGTGRHKIFTWDSGWVRLDSLTRANELESCNNLPAWRTLNRLCTTDESIGFKAMVDIIHARKGRINRSDFFTGLSGGTNAGLFPKACASIIKMAIGQTIGFPILRFFPQASTCATIFWRDLKTRFFDLGIASISALLMPTPLNGTGACLAASGTPRTPKTNGRTESNELQNVKSADPKHSVSGRKEDVIVPDYATEKWNERGIRTLFRRAWFAAINFSQTGTERQNTVRATVRPLPARESRLVYNLSLEKHHAYYANGILVANCTAVEGARRLGFQIANMELKDPARMVINQQWKIDLLKRRSQLASGHSLNYRT